MAKGKEQGLNSKINIKVSRPGVHAKTKTSKIKSSNSYKKIYKGQGR